MLTQELKIKWIAALRSGEYTQCQGRLEVVEGDKVSNCCLGVLNRVRGVSNESEHYTPLDDLLDNPNGIGCKIRATLANLNDGKGLEGDGNVPSKSFAEIADYIEANVTALDSEVAAA